MKILTDDILALQNPVLECLNSPRHFRSPVARLRKRMTGIIRDKLGVRITPLDIDDYKKADLASVIAKAEFVKGYGFSAKAIFTLACSPIDLGNADDHWALCRGIDALKKMACLDLPRSPVQLDGGIVNNSNLIQAESYSRQLSAFAWRGCRFPGLVDLEGLAAQRQALTIYINRAIESHQAEFYKKRKKQYDWADDASDDENDDRDFYRLEGRRGRY